MTRHMNRSTADSQGVVPLSSLAAGQNATIEDITINCADYIRRRLHMLGFAHGRAVTKIRQAPFGGPMVFHVCDVQMCLRRAQADMIMVRPAPQTAPQPVVESCATTALA